MKHNPQVVVGFEGDGGASLNCSTSNSVLAVWIKTLNKNKTYYVDLNGPRVNVSSDGQVLTFNNATLSDEEYYGCGFVQNGSYVLLEAFFLYVKGKEFFL